MNKRESKAICFPFLFGLYLKNKFFFMKKIILICIALLFFKVGKSQHTIMAGDSTNLETNVSFVHIDTTVGNIWQIGLPQKIFFGPSNSAPYSIMTDTINQYPTDNVSSFTVEFINPWGGIIPDVGIGFWHKFETDSLMDGGYVEISVDSGATWTNLVVDSSAMIFYPTNFYFPADTILGNIPAFSGTQSNWEYSEFFFQWLIPVISQHSDEMERDLMVNKVMFRFNFKSDGIENNKAGWIIDDIAIRIYDIGGSILENELANFEVKVFPNPMMEKGIIQVVSKNNEHNFTINIYNIRGQLISTSKMDKNDQYIINNGDLRNGIYFYSIKNQNGNYKSGKILIK